MKVGDAHGLKLQQSQITKYIFNSLNIVSLCPLGTGNGLSWYGLAPSFSSKETGLVFQSPSVPSKSSSNYMSNSSNLFWSWSPRWVQLVLTTIAFSCVASRIWTIHWVVSCVLCGLCAMQLFTVQVFLFLMWSDYWCLSLTKLSHQCLFLLFENPEPFLALSLFYTQKWGHTLAWIFSCHTQQHLVSPVTCCCLSTQIKWGSSHLTYAYNLTPA